MPGTGKTLMLGIYSSHDVQLLTPNMLRALLLNPYPPLWVRTCTQILCYSECIPTGTFGSDPDICNSYATAHTGVTEGSIALSTRVQSARGFLKRERERERENYTFPATQG